MIWTTAKSTDVNRPPERLARPGQRVRSGSSGGMPGGPRPAWRCGRTLRRRRRSRRPVDAVARRGQGRARGRPGGPRGPRARPTPGAGPGVIPAAASCSSVIWRCEVDGGWTTIVWTLPSEAVSSVSASVSMTARPASRPPTTLDGEHPAERVRVGTGGRRRRAGGGSADRGRGRAARHPDVRARPPVPRRSARGAPRARRG